MTKRVDSGRPRRLRGRDPEIGMLSRRLDELGQGRGGVVLIRGTAGLGKSALLTEAEAMARKRGARVYHGGSHVADRSLPLGPLLDALVTADDPPVDVTVLRELSGSVDQRYWLLRELQERLERAALSDAIVIGIDDIQWADAATLNAITILPRRLATHRILWLFVVRSGELSTSAQLAVARIRAENADILTVNPLDDSAIRAVCRDTLGGDPDARLQSIINRVGGQPLWLVELLRGLRDERLVDVVGDVAYLLGDAIPRRLLESVSDQLARLSPQTRRGLQMAAVLGRSFSVDELASLMDLPAAAVIEPVREALAAGLIVDHGDRLGFRHDLIREATEAELPSALKRSLQRRALDVLLEHGAPAADAATLVMEVARPGDRPAIDLLHRATVEIGRVSPTVAAQLSRRLLELTPDSDPDWSARVVETTDLLVHSGQAAEAENLIAQTTGRIDREAEAAARMTLGSLELQYGPAGCAEHCGRGLELPDLPPQLRVALLSLRACALEMVGDIDAAAACANEATAAAYVLDETFEAVVTLPPRALVAFDRGDWRAAVDLADRGVRDQDLADVPARRAWMFDAWYALILIALGQHQQALQLINAGTRSAEREGISANLRVWSMLRCRTMLALGRFADATAEAEAVMEMSDEIGEGGRGYINHIASHVLCTIALHTGDTAGLSAARRAAIQMQQVTHGRARPLAAWMLARLDAAQGTPAQSRQLDIALLDPLINGTPHVSSPRRYVDQPELVRVLLAGDHREDAIAVAGRLRAMAANDPDFPLLAATSTHTDALLDNDFGLADKAAALYEGGEEPVLIARALEDAGHFRPRNLRDEAVERLESALEIYVQVGARRDAARVRALLRQRGVRRMNLRTTVSAVWPELSDSELAVVRLVATGSTNREVAEQLFLSPHTVNAHLRQIFAKLGLRSRVELARLTAQRDAR
ncbi:LuxR C-terminal-related transcriptional regulator [Mycobacterium sp. Aquia_216]|uniref:helix-turn-helix transcriptional regulator n=1 Tax=Mycobacterium sp. Aquia_216 TaxID=2991729 RepID=UPI00227A4153|nr:LuxR family transcriptional regulator [Mycobacterium sp. Aquia_216]WAJ43717.1 LuxR C-terminal-related transcriptional regulator [Mycobacterium sp. Aquia_216]